MPEIPEGHEWKVMPWPWSSDSNGIDYPSGLKMLIPQAAYLDADEWDGDWETWAETNAGALVNAVCVPDSLPSGYSLNNTNEATSYSHGGLMRVKHYAFFSRCGQLQDYQFGYPEYDLSGGNGTCNEHPSDQATFFHAPKVWYRSPGYHVLQDHPWAPMPHNGYGVAPFGSYGGGSITISFPAFYGAGPEVSFSEGWVPVYQGWRYCKARYSSTGTIAGLHIKITRASDWSNAGGGPGGTTVQDVTLGSTTNVAQWSDLEIGEVLPPVGTMGYVHIQVWATGDAVQAGLMGVGIISGNRCDIPICTTTTYTDWQGTEHVVPGGYDSGILAFPSFVPGTLTGVFSAFDAEDNGDGKYVFLKFTGYASTSYTFSSDGFSVGSIQFFQGDEAVGAPQTGVGPPGTGPWTFSTGTDSVAWVIVDIHGDTNGNARFKVT